MPHINQNRSFEQRLTDFGPELGPFLRTVWSSRDSINLNNYRRGRSDIYRMYAGNAQVKPFDFLQLTLFINELRAIGRGNDSTCQGMTPRKLADYDYIETFIQAEDLWRAFFHVVHKRGGPSTMARAYVHANDWSSGLKIMKLIIGQFATNKGLWEVKTAGPGQMRLDTIVAYFYDRNSRDTIVQLLKETAQKQRGWFADSLPPLVKREERGIGSADNPPKIEITGGKAKHSFGSFYATICWLALKTVPNLQSPKAEPRHLLDNVLHILRLLKINPANPQQFPAKGELEAWYRNSIQKVANT